MASLQCTELHATGRIEQREREAPLNLTEHLVGGGQWRRPWWDRNPLTSSSATRSLAHHWKNWDPLPSTWEHFNCFVRKDQQLGVLDSSSLVCPCVTGFHILSFSLPCRPLWTNFAQFILCHQLLPSRSFSCTPFRQSNAVNLRMWCSWSKRDNLLH